MDLKECMEAMLDIWTEISFKELVTKPETKFIHDCPCCHYVVELVYGKSVEELKAEGIDRFRMDKLGHVAGSDITDSSERVINCKQFCPMKGIWPEGCEIEPTPYTIWHRYDTDVFNSYVDEAVNIILFEVNRVLLRLNKEEDNVQESK